MKACSVCGVVGMVRRGMCEAHYQAWYRAQRRQGINVERGEYRTEANQRRLEFFKTWTPESAWVYGLILGDGHVRLTKNDGRIWFCGNFDTVQKFNRLLWVEREPFEKRGAYHSYVDCRAVAQWFRSRGIESKKSHSLPWPEDLPEAFKWDFMRGLIDTDGSFIFNEPKKYQGRGRTNFQLGFNSASREFCDRVRHELASERALSESRKTMNGKEFTHYSFRVGGMEASLEVCRKLYDCPANIRNEERYLKFRRAEELWTEYNKGCKICGKPIHTSDLCMEHMWAAKLKEKPAKNCFCGAEAKLKGMCVAHYHQARRRDRNAATDSSVQLSPDV